VTARPLAKKCRPDARHNYSLNRTRIQLRFHARRLAPALGGSRDLKGLMFMEQAKEISGRVNSLLPRVKAGTLRFFGQWFGRPYDNYHLIESAKAKDGCLILTFDEKETLSVWNPSSFRISAEEFQIDAASRVLWQWFYYGRPRTPENLYFEDYVVEGGKIRTETNVDWYEPKLQPSLSEAAVKIY
jgi:hypothetical protein